MILADTHLVVGMIRRTDPDRAAQAAMVAERHAAEGEPLVVAECVLAECAWVLHTRYGMAGQDVARVLREALSTPALVPWDPDVAETALDIMEADPALDVTDCILAAMSARRGADVATMDRRLLRLLSGGETDSSG